MIHHSRSIIPTIILLGNYKYEVMDPNVRAGFELGLFDCEKSIRQLWMLNKHNQLEMTTTAIDTEAKDGYLARLCVGK